MLTKLFYSLFYWFFPKHDIEHLVNKPGNEMWRAGGGYHGYRKYFRIDWGTRGWRFIRKLDFYEDYWQVQFPALTKENSYLVAEYMEALIKEGQDNPEQFEHHNKVRGGGAVVRERVDLWTKTWAKARELLRKQGD